MNFGGIMSELRYNYLKDTWSIIAVERARRPHDFATQKVTNIGYLPHGFFNTKGYEHWLYQCI